MTVLIVVLAWCVLSVPIALAVAAVLTRGGTGHASVALLSAPTDRSRHHRAA